MQYTATNWQVNEHNEREYYGNRKAYSNNQNSRNNEENKYQHNYLHVECCHEYCTQEECYSDWDVLKEDHFYSGTILCEDERTHKYKEEYYV